MSSSTILTTALRWPFNLSNVDSITAHANMLIKARKLALKKPLYAGLTINWRFSKPLAEISGAPQGRPLPHFPRSVKPGTSRKLSLRLDHPLQSGVDMDSQVWVAEIIKQSNSFLPVPFPVVLKLVQPSLRPIPLSVSEIPWNYQEPEYAVRCEAEFYEKAKHLQGCTIPHFFGIQEMLAPSGETSWALLMEYIEGPTLDELVEEGQFETNGYNEQAFAQMCDIYKHTLEGLQQAHSANLIYGYRQPGSFIISSHSHQPVFVGFPSGKVSDSEHLKERERYDILRHFSGQPIYGEKVVDWAEKTLSGVTPRLVPNRTPRSTIEERRAYRKANRERDAYIARKAREVFGC